MLITILIIAMVKIAEQRIEIPIIVRMVRRETKYMDILYTLFGPYMDDITTGKMEVLAVCFLFAMLVPLGVFIGYKLLSPAQKAANASDSENTDKARLTDWLPTLITLCIGFYIYFKTSAAYGWTAHARAKYIMIIPAASALWNLKRRSVKQAAVLLAAFFSFAIIAFIGCIIIGAPQKAPEIELDTAKLTVGMTTVSELRQDGFILYIIKPDARSFAAAEDISAAYQAYDPTQKTMLPAFKGNRTLSGRGDTYILVKDGRVWGDVNLFGSRTDPTPLDDCVITEYAFFADQYKSLPYKDLPIKLDDHSIFDLTEAWLIDTYTKTNIHPPSEWGIDEAAEDRANHTDDKNYWIYNKGDDSINIWKRYQIDLTVHSADMAVKHLVVKCIADRYTYIGTYIGPKD